MAIADNVLFGIESFDDLAKLEIPSGDGELELKLKLNRYAELVPPHVEVSLVPRGPQPITSRHRTRQSTSQPMVRQSGLS